MTTDTTGRASGRGSGPAALALLALLLCSSGAAAAPLSLEQCLQIALQRSPELRGAAAELDAAEAARRSARGGFGPRLRLEASLLRWDGAVQSDFGAIPGLPVEVPPFEVRESLTSSVSFTLVQPLTPIWSILEGYKVQQLGVDLAVMRQQITRRELAYQVTEAFYRTLQATSLTEVAGKSVAQLEAQVARARSFVTHGVVGENDLLRAELGLAAARQRLIQSRAQASLARSRLGMLMGVAHEVWVQAPPAAAGQPGPTPAAGAAVEKAFSQRIELREIEARIGQARAGLRAAWSRLLPQLSLVGNYQHATGSSFQPEDSAYVGVVAAWDLWEWGSTYYGTSEARARRQSALAARDRLRDAIRLEARAAQLGQATAAEALQVARKAVQQAEENFRLERKRYQAQAATSFDVIDAETQLTGARAQLQTAHYDHLIARAALARATGEPIVASR